jgi:hypothetical protein
MTCFSSSTLKLLRECPRCFWLHFHGKKRPATIFPSLPGGMDNVLKDHFDIFRAKGELPPELDVDAALFADQAKLDEWRNWRKGLRASKGAHELMGAVDELLSKDGKIIVLDYKTRGYPVKENTPGFYQDQLDIYTYLLQANGHETVDYAYLLFYHPTGVLENGDVKFHAELVKVDVDPSRAEELFKEAISVVEGEEPEKTEGCGYCEW